LGHLPVPAEQTTPSGRHGAAHTHLAEAVSVDGRSIPREDPPTVEQALVIIVWQATSGTGRW